MVVKELIEYLQNHKEDNIIKVCVSPSFTGIVISKPSFSTPTLGRLTPGDATYISIPELNNPTRK